MFYVSCPPGVERVKLAVTMSIKCEARSDSSPVNGLMCRVPRSKLCQCGKLGVIMRSRLVVVCARIAELKVQVSSNPGRRRTREAVLLFRAVYIAGLQA